MYLFYSGILTGGIQRKRFAEVFPEKFVDDGTMSRFLATWEDTNYYPADSTEWDGEIKEHWEALAWRAKEFGDSRTRGDLVESLDLCLIPEARAMFVDWQNDLKAAALDLPEEFAGFLPKAFDYALRLAGVIYCIRRHAIGAELGWQLQVEDIQRGIAVAMFHLGQEVGILELLLGRNKEAPPAELDERQQHLLGVLRSLETKPGNNLFSVRLITARFLESCPLELKGTTEKAVGRMLRAMGFSPSKISREVDGGRNRSCLELNDKNQKLLKTYLQRLQSLHPAEFNTDITGNHDKPTLTKLTPDSPQGDEIQPLQPLEKQRLHSQPPVNTNDVSFASFVSVDSEQKPKADLFQDANHRHLIETLLELEGCADNGLMSIGFISDRYDLTCQPGTYVTKEVMEDMLRTMGFPVSDKVHNANGQHAERCLLWNEKTISILKQCWPSG